MPSSYTGDTARTSKPDQPRVFYRIKDWHILFENNRTRELKYLEWVAFPNPMLIGGGEAYAELMDHQDGAAHFAVFCACVFLASRSHLRGTLLRSSAAPSCDPMSQASIALTSRIPAGLVRDACERLVLLGWLEELPVTKLNQLLHATKSQDAAGLSQESRTNMPGPRVTRARDARVRNGTERNSKTPPAPPSDEGGSPPLAKTSNRHPRGMTKAEELTCELYKQAQQGNLG